MILGIWDGHDSGAAIVNKGKIIVAVNEERFTRRKLEVLFPRNSIMFCLESQGLKPGDIEDVAYSTSDFSLTLTRTFPKIKNNYYYVRKRIKKNRFEDVNRKILNLTGRIEPNRFLEWTSNRAIKKELNKLGFNKFNLNLVEHHKAHAASAYLTSGMNKALTITIDGLGDGLSSTASVCNKGEIECIKETKTKDSLGLFYQEVTSLLKMKILEDEGKVMCLADYSKPIPKDKNPMLRFFNFKEDKINAAVNLNKRFKILKKILENTNRESFCRMAQDALEHFTLIMFKQLIEEAGIKNICLAGGIFSNIKNNKSIVENLDVKDWFVFPHMGDGGLAVGAALFVDNYKNNTKPYKLSSVSLGPEYSEEDIMKVLKNYKNKLTWNMEKDISGYAAEEIGKLNIIYWFQGKTEYGPRALGNRSLLSRVDKKEMRDRINKVIKRRCWYQPFCPSILEKEARKLLEPFIKPDPFMTMGYQIKESKRYLLEAAQSVDGSCRPQITPESNWDYASLLKKLKNITGTAAVLNTSFNIHRYPLVTSPGDAIKTLLRIKQGSLLMGNLVIKLR